LPVSVGGIDFSPILVILGIYFLRSFIVNSLFRFASSLM
jgi:YggT family protein